MKKIYGIEITLRSALHINAGVDQSGVRVTVKADGRPYIPATLFKGLVRAEFSALLEALGEDSAGISERFFGGEGFCRSHTIFSDLLTEQESTVELRTNISTDRYTRKVYDGALVKTEVQPQCDRNGAAVVFSGDMTVYYTDDDMLRYEPVLRKAVEQICSIGTGKSRGLGFVRTSLAEKQEEAADGAASGGRKYVEFTLESDVMTGGVRNSHDLNFMTSENVISGQVLRAAFANEILLGCPYADEEVDGRVNFVTYRGKEACGGCKNSEACRRFSDMSFSALMIENSLPVPFTLRICKTCGDKHPLMDTIAGSGMLKCPVCKSAVNTVTPATGRMENAKGFADRSASRVFKPKRSTSMHTAIDPYTGTVENGSLFSINALRRGQVYSGIIDDCGSGMLREGAVLYVGKYSSNGFGRLRITKISEPEQRDITGAIDEFNRRFGEQLSCKYGSGKRFAAVLLTSDAKLDISSSGGILSTEDYRSAWERALFSGSEIRLEQIYAQTFTWSGYDTSVRTDSTEERRKPTELITEKGTSLLVSFAAGAESALVRLEQEGVGADRNIGYGQVMVCSRLHSLGIKTEENR